MYIGMEMRNMYGLWHSAETFDFIASPLARSYNRCVCGLVTSLPHSNCAFGTTSHTPQPLYEIVLEIERKPEGEECLKYHTP